MPDFDIKKAMEDVSRLEKMQAQIELRSNQIKEFERKLDEKIKSTGIAPKDLDAKIKELEASILERLTHIKSLDNGQENT